MHCNYDVSNTLFFFSTLRSLMWREVEEAKEISLINSHLRHLSWRKIFSCHLKECENLLQFPQLNESLAHTTCFFNEFLWKTYIKIYIKARRDKSLIASTPSVSRRRKSELFFKQERKGDVSGVCVQQKCQLISRSVSRLYIFAANSMIYGD